MNMDAPARFVDSMGREITRETTNKESSSDLDNIDFSTMTEASGRTVAQMVTEESGPQRTVTADSEYNNLILSSSGRAVDQLRMGLSESEREELIKSLGTNQQSGDTRPVGSTSAASFDSKPAAVQAGIPYSSTKARSIPVPGAQYNTSVLPQSQASSQGSSGSNFLSSVLNPAAPTFINSTFGGNMQQQQLSHTPPAASSYETSHFGKRMRSGSVSGRLRSASEHLEEKGLLDRQTKGILKDLIIIGDEVLQQAIDRYEAGDPSALEDMVSSGALQERLPKDIDILGDLDLDFLTVDSGGLPDVDTLGDIEPLQSSQAHEPVVTRSHTTATQSIAMQPPPAFAPHPGQVVAMAQAAHRQPNMVSPPYDDGIGELEFSGEFVADQGDYMEIPHHQTFGASKQNSAAGSPADTNMSEYEWRMRSNSLFSALLSDPRGGNTSSGTEGMQDLPTGTDVQYGQWMADRPDAAKPGININRRSSAPSLQQSGIGASLETYKASGIKLTKEEQKRLEKQNKKELKEKEKLERKDRKVLEKKKAADEYREEHVPGSGRPRSLSDPNIRTTYDDDGLVQVDRPEGWVGAYSPDSRKARIGRFMEKRNHRVWTKTVKYDVRKNFADSRLRVKGRFVKKEDELLMRELMSLT